MSPAFILPEMTWPEAKDAFDKAELAIIPVGSFEQHSPYMTFTVDSERAYAFSKLLAARLYPRVLVAPPITFGISHHHMNFPGTITLRHETLDAMIYDIVWSLREHGIRQFFLVNGHGGNAPSLNVMIVRLRHELAVLRRRAKRPPFQASDRWFLTAAARSVKWRRYSPPSQPNTE